MNQLEEKREIIFKAEKQFANDLVGTLFKLHELSIWMIFIPVLFVYVFYQIKRVKLGRADFIDQFMVSINRAMNGAFPFVQNGEKADTDKMAAIPKIPENAWPAHAQLISIRVEHYVALLKSSGSNFSEMVRNAYGTRGNFSLHLEKLNDAERALNSALNEHLRKKIDSDQSINDAIHAIENHSEALRKKNIDIIFAQKTTIT